MNKPCTQHFAALNEYVERIQHQISATAAATYILHKQEVVNEWYSGTQTVVVRMYNQQGGNPASYDYLGDIKTFGNMVCTAIKQM